MRNAVNKHFKQLLDNYCKKDFNLHDWINKCNDHINDYYTFIEHRIQNKVEASFEIINRNNIQDRIESFAQENADKCIDKLRLVIQHITENKEIGRNKEIAYISELINAWKEDSQSEIDVDRRLLGPYPF